MVVCRPGVQKRRVVVCRQKEYSREQWSSVDKESTVGNSGRLWTREFSREELSSVDKGLQ